MEDVKTILQLVVVSISIWVIVISLYLHPIIDIVPANLTNFTLCSSFFLFEFTYRPYWCSIVGTLIHEFVIYPVLGNRIPNFLHRIGLGSFLIIALSSGLLTLELVQSNKQVTLLTTSILYCVSKGLLCLLISCATLELILAQAPYNMRGLFAGYLVILFVVSIYAGDCLSFYSLKLCKDCNIRLIILGVKLAVSLCGFLLYCFLARWCKMRVRDDVYSVHRVVEEVYDRYLTAESQRRQLYLK